MCVCVCVCVCVWLSGRFWTHHIWHEWLNCWVIAHLLLHLLFTLPFLFFCPSLFLSPPSLSFKAGYKLRGSLASSFISRQGKTTSMLSPFHTSPSLSTQKKGARPLCRLVLLSSLLLFRTLFLLLLFSSDDFLPPPPAFPHKRNRTWRMFLSPLKRHAPPVPWYLYDLYVCMPSSISINGASGNVCVKVVCLCGFEDAMFGKIVIIILGMCKSMYFLFGPKSWIIVAIYYIKKIISIYFMYFVNILVKLIIYICIIYIYIYMCVCVCVCVLLIYYIFNSYNLF